METGEMERKIRELYLRMIEFDAGQPALIQHFTKVYSYARLIAEAETEDLEIRNTVEAAALVHDIAIPMCREKYGSDAGPLQEREGPELARNMLMTLGFPEDMTQRVCALVGEHHTYLPIDGMDHQILIEADFIVNSFEGEHGLEKRRRILEDIFKTDTGRHIYAEMFGMT